MGRKQLQKNRQEQIAMELGLIPDPEKERLARLAKEKSKKEEEERLRKQVVQAPGWECPDCPGGKHPVKDGWCINGRFWSHGEIFRMKEIAVQQPELPKKLVENKALMMLKDSLGLDFSTLEVHPA